MYKNKYIRTLPISATVYHQGTPPTFLKRKETLTNNSVDKLVEK